MEILDRYSAYNKLKKFKTDIFSRIEFCVYKAELEGNNIKLKVVGTMYKDSNKDTVMLDERFSNGELREIISADDLNGDRVFI